MPETVLVEILSADPIGPLSLSQGRTAVQGDVLASLLDFFGYEVRREYYVNDMGRRAAFLCDSVRDYILSDVVGETVDGRYDPSVRTLAERLLNEHGSALQEATDEDWKPLCDSIPHLFLQSQQDTLSRLGLSYGTWFDERSLVPDAVEAALRRVKEAGCTTESGGALWLDTKGRDRALLRRENGDYTYTAVDVAYHLSKVERGAHRMIDVWGPAYHRHRDRIREAMQALKVETPLEVIVTGGIQLANDGAPVAYLNAASVTLDSLLERGSVAGLRFLLNGAPPEEDLALELDNLNRNDLPPAVSAAWAALDVLQAQPGSSGEDGSDLRSLKAALQPLASAGGTLPLVPPVRQTESLLQQACSQRRPDLLNAHLIALTDAYTRAGGEARATEWEEPVRRGLQVALTATLSLLGLMPEQK